MNTSSRTLLALSAAVLVAVSWVTGQEPGQKSSPARGDMSAVTNMLGQLSDTDRMTAQLDSMFNSMLDYMSKPEFAAKLARFHKVHLEALVKEGFTREEAIRIITSSNFLHFNSK